MLYIYIHCEPLTDWSIPLRRTTTTCWCLFVMLQWLHQPILSRRCGDGSQTDSLTCPSPARGSDCSGVSRSPAMTHRRLVTMAIVTAFIPLIVVVPVVRSEVAMVTVIFSLSCLSSIHFSLIAFTVTSLQLLSPVSNSCHPNSLQMRS